jgi:membrane protease YdiL (CAAX protease family)
LELIGIYDCAGRPDKSGGGAVFQSVLLRWHCRPEAFAAYVARAGEGRNSAPRIAVGFILIVLFHIIFAVAAFVVGPFILKGYDALLGIDRPLMLYFDTVDTFFVTRFGLALLLGAIGCMWLGTWFVVRIVHKRKLSGLMGATARLSWRDFAASFAVWFVVGAISSAVFFAMDATAARSETALLDWGLVLIPLSLFILFQSSAEELVFRGYLQQSLAHRFPHWCVWAALPAIVFTLLHWDSDALPWMNAAYLASILVFSVAMTLLVYATGNLGAAFGAHCANNIIALLLFGADSDYRSAALFVGLPMQDPTWTPIEAALLVILSIALTAIALAFSLHPRSPFKLRGKPAHSREVVQVGSPAE